MDMVGGLAETADELGLGFGVKFSNTMIVENTRGFLAPGVDEVYLSGQPLHILAMHLVPLKLDYFSASSRQFVIYCRTGSRSAQVCRFLNQQGIHNVISLRGGVVKWTSGGFPLDSVSSGTIT